MKVLHEEINGCHECPYMVDWASGCLECRGDMAFDFHCCKIKPARLVASEIERSAIKNEQKHGAIVTFQIEFPSWCPLKDKE